MYVPSYQMHNVLNVYSKQLTQNKIAGNKKLRFKKTLNDQLNLSPEGKRKTTIEKVATEILKKITRLEFKNDPVRKSVSLPKNEAENDVELDAQKGNQFIYNVMDEINTKKTNTLSVEDTHFLMNQLERWAKGAIEKKGETGRSGQLYGRT